MTPDVSPAETAVLVALVLVYERAGRVTVRDVAAVVHRSPSTVQDAIRRLRVKGLVSHDLGRAGTLRPLVRRVA